MSNSFKKLNLQQVQENLQAYMGLAKRPIPKKGWIRTIRDALGMSSYVLARILKCSRANIAAIEKREKEGSITLNTLNEVAQAIELQVSLLSYTFKIIG